MRFRKKHNDDVLVSINEELKKQNSKRTAFELGVLRGLGTALGATIIFAILTSILIKLGTTFHFGNIIQHYLSTPPFE